MLITSSVQNQKSTEKTKSKTKREQNNHGLYKKLKVGSGAVEEKPSSAKRSQPPCALWYNREKHKLLFFFNEKTVPVQKMIGKLFKIR